MKRIDITLARVLAAYLEEVKLAKDSSDYTGAVELLNILSDYQLIKADQNIIPKDYSKDLEQSLL